MENTNSLFQDNQIFGDDARAAVYRTIFSRRDVRGQFLPDSVPNAVMSRILMAAHHAPSVGFMQPWSFIIVKSPDIRARIKALFETAHSEAAEMFDDDKRAAYQNLRLEGILESPVNLCITCDRDRAGPVVIGRTHIPEMDLYSTVCAVQNLWLAARAEGLGVGWVSIIGEAGLKKELGLPDHVVPVAYLCLGYVSQFFNKPELELADWRSRLQLDDLVAFDRWDGKPTAACDDALLERLRGDQEAARSGSFVETRLA